MILRFKGNESTVLLQGLIVTIANINSRNNSLVKEKNSLVRKHICDNYDTTLKIIPKDIWKYQLIVVSLRQIKNKHESSNTTSYPRQSNNQGQH